MKLLPIIISLFVLTTKVVVGQPKSLINKNDTILYLPFEYGKAPFSINGQMGIIDTNKNVLLPPVYSRIRKSREGYGFWYVYSNDGKEGVINYLYKVIIPCEYEYISSVSNGFFIVQKGGKYSYIDWNGKPINKWFEKAESFSRNMLAAVQINKKWGIINKNGDFKVEPSYDEFIYFDENNLAAVRQGKNWGFIDTSGRVRIPVEFESVKIPSLGNLPFPLKPMGLYAVKKSGKWGYIDKEGKVIINYQYNKAEPFHNGLAIVKKNGRYGFIDQQNEIIIPFKYKEAEPFYNEFALVKKGRKYGFINKENKVILPFKYRYLMRTFAPGDKVAMVKINSLTRLKWINIKGE